MQRKNQISVNHFELWEFVWWKLINRKSIIIGSCKVVVELSLEFYDSNASYHSCYSQELKQIRKALATSFISGDPLKQNILQEQILLWFVSLRGKYYLYFD